jgi:hypothetical protein
MVQTQEPQATLHPHLELLQVVVAEAAVEMEVMEFLELLEEELLEDFQVVVAEEILHLLVHLKVILEDLEALAHILVAVEEEQLHQEAMALEEQVVTVQQHQLMDHQPLELVAAEAAHLEVMLLEGQAAEVEGLVTHLLV